MSLIRFFTDVEIIVLKINTTHGRMNNFPFKKERILSAERLTRPSLSTSINLLSGPPLGLQAQHPSTDTSVLLSTRLNSKKNANMSFSLAKGIIHGHYSTDENWPQFIVFCLNILFRFFLADPPGSRVTVISWDEQLYLLAVESEEFLQRLDDFQGSGTLTFSFLYWTRTSV